LVSWPEVVVAILNLVDRDSICDFSGQGVPLVDHPVCECVGPLQTFSRSLARQSPRMTSDSSGGAGLREWAAVDRGSPNLLRWCRWRLTLTFYCLVRNLSQRLIKKEYNFLSSPFLDHKAQPIIIWLNDILALQLGDWTAEHFVLSATEQPRFAQTHLHGKKVSL